MNEGLRRSEEGGGMEMDWEGFRMVGGGMDSMRSMGRGRWEEEEEDEEEDEDEVDGWEGGIK